MRNRSSDLTSVLVNNKKGTVKYGQGVIISWDPTNLNNIIEWDGATLVNLPVLAGLASASGFKSGQSVGLLGWDPTGKGGSTQWWVLGRIVVPGETAFAEPGQYTPGLTASNANPVLGDNSTQLGFWYLTGGCITVWVFIQFGDTGASSGDGHYFVSLPFKPFADLLPIWSGTTGTVAGLGLPVGVATSRDQSATGSSQSGVVVLAGSEQVAIQQNAGSVPWGAAVPFAWAASDRLLLTCSYIIDPDQEVEL